MDDVKLPLEPGRHPGGPAQQRVGPGRRRDGNLDALGRLPDARRLMPPEVLEKLLVRLVRQEAQRQVAQGDQAARPGFRPGASCCTGTARRRRI